MTPRVSGVPGASTTNPVPSPMQPIALVPPASPVSSAANGGNQYIPFHKIGYWVTKKDRRAMASGVIVFPSGVTKYNVDVAADGKAIRVEITWPSVVCNVDLMFSKFYAMRPEDGGFTEYHQRVLAIEAELAKQRSRADKPIETTTLLPLPFEVSQDMPWEYNLEVPGGVHYYLFDVQSVVNNFATPKKMKPVESVNISPHSGNEPTTPAL